MYKTTEECYKLDFKNNNELEINWCDSNVLGKWILEKNQLEIEYESIKGGISYQLESLKSDTLKLSLEGLFPSNTNKGTINYKIWIEFFKEDDKE